MRGKTYNTMPLVEIMNLYIDPACSQGIDLLSVFSTRAEVKRGYKFVGVYTLVHCLSWCTSI